MTSLAEYVQTPNILAQFTNALKDQAPVFLTSLVEIVASEPKLQLCQQADLVKAALKAATMGLPLARSLGQAYIIPYERSRQINGRWEKYYVPEFVIGYRGFIQLALRTGRIRTINADCVYDGELVSADKMRGTFVIDPLQRKSDRVIGYFAYLETKDGFVKQLYSPIQDVAEHAEKYAKGLVRKDQSGNIVRTTAADLIAKANQPQQAVGKQAGAVGWEGNFHEMAIKTLLRELLQTYSPVAIVIDYQQPIMVEEAVNEEVQEVQEIETSRHRDIETSRHREIEKSGNREIEKSRNPGIQEVPAAPDSPNPLDANSYSIAPF